MLGRPSSSISMPATNAHMIYIYSIYSSASPTLCLSLPVNSQITDTSIKVEDDLVNLVYVDCVMVLYYKILRTSLIKYFLSVLILAVPTILQSMYVLHSLRFGWAIWESWLGVV